MNERDSRGRAKLVILAALVTFAVAVTVPESLTAQARLAAVCHEPEVVALGARDACIAAAQAAVAAQPVIGLVYSGGTANFGLTGDARPGGASSSGSLGIRANVVQLDLPDIVSDRFDLPEGYVETLGVVIPSILVDGSLSVFQGVDHSPGIGGIGALSVIGTLSFVPFSVEADGVRQADYATGVGVRVQLLRESFTAPAIAATAMRRSLRRVSWGNLCPGGPVPITNPVDNPDLPLIAACPGPGDPGEVNFDLTNWSGRFTIAKSLAGFSGLVGFGYDTFESEVGFGARSSVRVNDATPIFRFRDLPLESSRWLMFGGISFNLFVASITAEAGWQRGAPPLSDFDSLGSGFDPEDGALFGSIGARVSF